MVFCVTMLSGARLIDVSYSIKQNGVMINIDYDVDPTEISKTINITVQGGLNPNFLIGSKAASSKSSIAPIRCRALPQMISTWWKPSR